MTITPYYFRQFFVWEIWDNEHLRKITRYAHSNYDGEKNNIFLLHFSAIPLAIPEI